MFQKKLRDLQKWHNDLEFRLFRCRDYTKSNLVESGGGSLSSGRMDMSSSNSDIERNEL